MNAFRKFLQSLVTNSQAAQDSVLSPDDFPLTAVGTKLSKPDGEPVATATDPATATELADRLNEDEQRKEEDRWSA